MSAADSAASNALTTAHNNDLAALAKANDQITAIEAQTNAQASAQQASDDNTLAATEQTIISAQQKLGLIVSTAAQSKSNIQAGAATDLASKQSAMAAGKAQHERDWKTALIRIFSAVDIEKAGAAQSTYFGYTASQWWDIGVGSVKGAAQGAVNTAYGVEQGVVGMANFALTITGIAGVAGVFGWNIKIPDYDWSKGLIVTESTSAHNLSVFLGGQGLTTLLTLGASALADSGIICELTGWGCFVSGTEVVTGENANGTFSETPIQDIQVGDDVLSRNQYDPNGPLQEELVTGVEQHTVYTLQDVTIKAADGTTETITATPNHPFYVEGQGFTAAGDLIAGDELEQPDGSYATVVDSVGDPASQGVTVYNLTVSGDHTYFVANDGAVIWVHNTCTAAQLAANGVKGAAAEAEVLNFYKALGYNVQRQVAVRTAAGLRYIDVAVQDGTTLYAIEIKSGNAVRSAAQIAKDTLIDAGQYSLTDRTQGLFNGIKKIVSLNVGGF